MRNGWASSIRVEAESAFSSQHDAGGEAGKAYGCCDKEKPLDHVPAVNIQNVIIVITVPAVPQQSS
jgi:hypothetical protein